MLFREFAVTLAAEYRRNFNLSIIFSSGYKQIFMRNYRIIRWFKLVISGAFHDPRIVKLIICNDTFTSFIINIINPFWLSVFIKNHFLECMKIFFDRIFICILSVIDSCKIIVFCSFHHIQFSLFFCICNCFNCNCNLLWYAYSTTGKCNGQMSCHIIITGKAIQICCVSINLNSICIGGYRNFLVFKYIILIFIFDSGISWKLKIWFTIWKINCFFCIKINYAVCCVILVQDFLKFFFCSSSLTGSLYCNCKSFSICSKIIYRFYIRI